MADKKPAARRRYITMGLVLGAALLAAAAALVGGGRQQPEKPRILAAGVGLHPGAGQQARAERPLVDAVFVLDTTGSMGGLLEGAKRHIWSIASRLASGQPRPDVRIGLVAYRDHGDTYVTRHFDLDGNMDDVYKNLVAFRAAGGGDNAEHVNKGIQVAIDAMAWRQGKKVLRQIYLVGDAPPHEGRDGLRSAELVRRAQAKGIVINAVRCGSQDATQIAWKRIAEAAGGLYASVAQDGGMRSYKTPYDKRLAKLNADLSSTLLPSGKASLRVAARRRVLRNAAMPAPAQAASAAFRARAKRMDSGDLIDQLGKGKKLESYKDSELPAAVAALPAKAREGYVRRVAAKRKALQHKILSLTRQREAHLEAKRRAKGAKPAVDDLVDRALRKQGKRAGIKY